MPSTCTTAGSWSRGCFVAEENEGKIVGVSVAVCWGTLGLFGPVAVLTPYQNQKVAQQLVRAAQAFFDENRVTLQGVVTFPYSPKHLVLYQKFDFKPRALVAITARSLERREPGPPAKPGAGAGDQALLDVRGGQEEGAPHAAGPSPGAFTGARLTKEIEIVDGLALGDTLVLEKDGSLLGFAICHTPGVSEAPQGALYVKYLAIDPAKRRPEHFVQLLTACEDFGVNAGCQRIIAPVYTGYWKAYQTVLASGYHVDMLMLRMSAARTTT